MTPRTSGLTDMLSKRGIGWTPGVAALVAALALGGLAAGSALAQAGMRGSSSTAAGDDELGTEPGHWGSPRLQKQVDLWLDRVNATADQRTRIHGILDRARPELQTAARQWRRDLQQLRTALTGQSVDRKQADMARQDAARVFDRASITFTNALADMSQVLTPDQRNKLAQQLS